MNKLKKHLFFSSVTFLVWVIFILIGLPSYYTDWQQESRVLLAVMWVGAIAPLLVFGVLIFVQGNYFKNSIILALYGSPGLVILDMLYINISSNGTTQFIHLPDHWLQITGYIAVAIEFPALGFLMNVLKKRKQFRGKIV